MAAGQKHGRVLYEVGCHFFRDRANENVVEFVIWTEVNITRQLSLGLEPISPFDQLHSFCKFREGKCTRLNSEEKPAVLTQTHHLTVVFGESLLKRCPDTIILNYSQKVSGWLGLTFLCY